LLELGQFCSRKRKETKRNETVGSRENEEEERRDERKAK
jgi:hypothetical protein